jgi:lipopolysaccharide export system ATP-binding protein
MGLGGNQYVFMNFSREDIVTEPTRGDKAPETAPEAEGTAHRAVLRTVGLVKRFKKRTVVNGVSVHIGQGQIVGLLGPNGAGKTTTFRMVVGILHPNGGKVFLDDRDITRLPMYKRARLGINYLPQEPSIFRKLTVEENIMSILQTMPLKRRQRKERLEQLLEELGVTHIRKSEAYTLSGGERRRVEIARTLASDPSFILLDEPFTGVDPKAVEEIQNIVRALRDKGIGVLITDHNVRETLAITERSYICFEGKILTQGSSDQIANDPDAQRYYLGDRFSM